MRTLIRARGYHIRKEGSAAVHAAHAQQLADGVPSRIVQPLVLAVDVMVSTSLSSHDETKPSCEIGRLHHIHHNASQSFGRYLSRD